MSTIIFYVGTVYVILFSIGFSVSIVINGIKARKRQKEYFNRSTEEWFNELVFYGRVSQTEYLSMATILGPENAKRHIVARYKFMNHIPFNNEDNEYLNRDKTES